MNGLFMDGFEQYARTSFPMNLMRYAGYTIQGSAQVADGRTDYDQFAKSVVLFRSHVRKDFPFQAAAAAVGVAAKFTARGGLLRLKFTGGDVTVWSDIGTGLVWCGDIHGYVMPVKNKWYYYECVIDKTANTVTVFVNGKQDIVYTVPFDISADQAVTVVMNPYDQPPNSTEPEEVDAATRWFDDLYFIDGPRLGPIQVNTRFPTSEVLAQWLSTEDQATTPNYQVVSTNNVQELDKYLHSDQDGAQERYLADTPVYNAPLVAIGTLSLVRRATPDPVTFVQFIDSQEVSTQDVPLSYGYKFATMDAAQYDSTTILASEFGVRINT